MIRKITKKNMVYQTVEYLLSSLAMTTTVISIVLNSVDKLKKSLMNI